MRSSLYRPRTNSGRGGGGRGGGGMGRAASGGRARLAVPRPVQTSSLKSESGVFDLTTILVPAASKDQNGAGTWGRTVETKVEAEAITHGSSRLPGGGPPPSSDLTSASVPRERELVDRSSLGVAPPPPDAGIGIVSTGAASVATDPTSAPLLPHHHENSAQRVPANPTSGRHTVVAPHQRSPPLRPSVASPTTTRSWGGGIPPPTLSDQLFPPLSMDRPLEKNPTGAAESAAAGTAVPLDSSLVDVSSDRPALADAAVVVMEPAPSVFQTPSPDDAETAEERERRRRALALEQQRLILQQVAAARAARAATQKKTVPQSQQQKHPQKPVNRIMRRSAGAGTDARPRAMQPKAATAVPPPERPAVTRKEPRTKGRLYARMPDGTLVEDQPHPDPAAVGENYDPNDESEASSETGTKSESCPLPAAAAEDKSSPSVPVPLNKTETTTDATNWKSVPGKPTKKKSWVSQKRRPKKHQVAAVNN